MYSARNATYEKVGRYQRIERVVKHLTEVREVRKEKANGQRVRVASEPSPKDL